MGQSYFLSDYYGKYLLTENQWTVEEKLPGPEIQAHIKKLLSKVQLRILVVGNMYREVRAKHMIIDNSLIRDAGGYKHCRASRGWPGTLKRLE